MSAYKAVIFDRDATLNRTTQILRAGQAAGDKTDGYVLAPHELELFPAVKPALVALRALGVLPFVFTQQNCIGKGLVSADDVAAIHAHMNGILGTAAAIEKFYLAWSVPGQPEDARAKPSPAMILEMMQEYALKPADVLAAGDSMRDYKSARAAGVDFVWIRDDLGRVSEADMQATGCKIYDDVQAMVRDIFPHAPKFAPKPVSGL
ncbi:MAG TPA: HAD-IIIA family hydrolase [Alphaproteobacteria bacterium]|nr:HAD-IIIA family hydrolase [Alphaproteobacteria bacterium]